MVKYKVKKDSDHVKILKEDSVFASFDKKDSIQISIITGELNTLYNQIEKLNNELQEYQLACDEYGIIPNRLKEALDDFNIVLDEEYNRSLYGIYCEEEEI